MRVYESTFVPFKKTMGRESEILFGILFLCAFQWPTTTNGLVLQPIFSSISCSLVGKREPVDLSQKMRGEIEIAAGDRQQPPDSVKTCGSH